MTRDDELGPNLSKRLNLGDEEWIRRSGGGWVGGDAGGRNCMKSPKKVS